MRIIHRGNQAKFTQSFKDGTTPLTPLSANYPQYAIIDISGATIQSGVGTLETTGTYYTNWTPLLTANVSNENESGNWRIEWKFKDSNKKEYTFTENFILQDEVAIEEAGREQKYLAMAEQEYLAHIKFPTPVHSIKLNVVRQSSEESLLDVAQASIIHREHGSLHTYEYKIPAATLKANVEYIMLWTVQDSAASAPRFVYQSVSSVSIRILSMIPEVRIFLDKFQKIAGSIQAYEDSDIYTYLKHGLGVINSTHPATSWCIQANSPAFAMPIFHYWIMAACWNGLLAQHLLEVDSSFSFCISKKTWIPTRKGMVTAGSLVDNEKLQIKKKTCLSIIKPTDKQIITKLIKTFDKPFYLQDAVDTLKLECNSMSLGHLLSKFH